jgi:hypothetical protein
MPVKTLEKFLHLTSCEIVGEYLIIINFEYFWDHLVIDFVYENGYFLSIFFLSFPKIQYKNICILY